MNIADRRRRRSRARRATNFTVLRVKRDILRRSTHRRDVHQPLESRRSSPARRIRPTASTRAFSFFQNLDARRLLRAHRDRRAATATTTATRRAFDYVADRYGAQARVPEGRRQLQPRSRLRPPRQLPALVRLAALQPAAAGRIQGACASSPGKASLEYLENGAGQLETRSQTGRFDIELQNSDSSRSKATRNYELLLRPFTVADRRRPSRPAATRSTTSRSRYADRAAAAGLGHAVAAARRVLRRHDHRARLHRRRGSSILKQFSVEPSVSINRRRRCRPATFTTTLLRARTDYGFSPRMFASALLQYSSTDQRVQQQPALPLGIPPGQRVLRRLHRRARHAAARLSRPQEPRVRGEGQPAASLLGRTRCSLSRHADVR